MSSTTMAPERATFTADSTANDGRGVTWTAQLTSPQGDGWEVGITGEPGTLDFDAAFAKIVAGWEVGITGEPPVPAIADAYTW